jgi:hypothetical protein
MHRKGASPVLGGGGTGNGVSLPDFLSRAATRKILFSLPCGGILSLLSRAITGPARPGFAFSRQDLPGQSPPPSPNPNDALDKWFQKQDGNTREMVYDLFHVNGDNNLENLRRSDQTWKVRRMEE